MKFLTTLCMNILMFFGSIGSSYALPECMGSPATSQEETYTWNQCIGTLFYSFGAKYIGVFKNARPHGRGIFTFANGGKHSGEYRDGKRHGQGTYTYPNGSKYVGEYRYGKKNGRGVITFSKSGNRYVGEFRNGNIHGEGVKTFSDGRVMEGVWNNNKFQYSKKLLPKGSKKETAETTKFVQSNFAEVTLNLPYPDKLCRFTGKSDLERLRLERQMYKQKSAGNRLFGMWGDCKSIQSLRRGVEQDLREWVVIVGTLTGVPKKERIYSKLSPALYLKMLAKKYDKISFDDVMNRVNKRLEKANSLYFNNGKALSVAEPISLGILAVTDSLHSGLIFNVKAGGRSVPVLAITSSSLVKGVPINFYFYSIYKNKNTLQRLLPKAEYYSAKLTHANERGFKVREKSPHLNRRKGKARMATSGSGFFVSSSGHVITNHHVVGNCKRVTVGDNPNKQIPARIVEADKKNDLALLRILSPKKPSKETEQLLRKLAHSSVPLASKGLFRLESISLGEDILVAGYPYGKIFSNTIKVTKGIVSANRGLGDDTGQFQIDAAVQPGNSGGPIYDENGNIVGIVVAQLNKLKFAKVTGSLPENVNFGIKGTTVRQFLISSGLVTKWANRSIKKSTKELAQIAKRQTLMVRCNQ